MQARSAVIAIAVLGSAGCIALPTVDTSKQASAAVMGQVVRSDGVTPVGGPIVGAELFSAVVNNTTRALGRGSVIADDHGRFLFIFQPNGEDPQTGSVNVSVAAPIGSGLLSKDTLSIPVRISLGLMPTDTTFVLIKLLAR